MGCSSLIVGLFFAALSLVDAEDATAPSSGDGACGTAWDTYWGWYILAQSGAGDCGDCGAPIESYEECFIASASGAQLFGIGTLSQPESWGGPPGCHIEDGDKFQWNDYAQGSGYDRHTPVCRTGPSPQPTVSSAPSASPPPTSEGFSCGTTTGVFSYSYSEVLCFEVEGLGIVDFMIVENGLPTCRFAHPNSCPEGFNIWVPCGSVPVHLSNEADIV